MKVSSRPSSQRAERQNVTGVSHSIGDLQRSGPNKPYRDRTHRKTFVPFPCTSLLRPINASRLAHIGYFVALTKIADFLRAGVEVGPTSSTAVQVIII